MTSAPIPFVNTQESGSDELGGATQLALNVVVDKKGTVRRRPGIRAASGVPTFVTNNSPVIGVYVSQDGRVFAVDQNDRKIWSMNALSSFALTSITGEDWLRGAVRPIFAETEALIVIAGGAEPQKIVFETLDTSILAGSPPNASHVIANGARLLLNNLSDYTGLVHFSDLASGSSYAGHEVWTAGLGTAGYFSTESRPDPVGALMESRNEVIAVGTTTLQAFAPDAQSTYAPASAVEYGTNAPYSVIRDDNSLAFFDNLRRFVVSDTRDVESLSDAIRGTLESIASPTDCFGFRVLSNSLDAYAWVFPTDGRSFVYQKGSGWGEWNSGTLDDPHPLAISSACISQVDGRNLVGTPDGRIAELSMDAADDLGAPFSAVVRTGFLAHDTDNRKWCKSVKLALRRGEYGTGAATAMLGFRDRNGPWQWIRVDIGADGDTEATVIFRSLGIYRRRQWAFEFTGARQMILAGATEEFEVLEA
jgi:hypothetical protein